MKSLRQTTAYYSLAALSLVALATACTKEATPLPEGQPIQVNQVGYYPNAEKVAVIESEGINKSYKLTDANGKTVWEGEATRQSTSPWSAKVRDIVDFSTVTTPGTYTLHAGLYTQQVVIAEHAVAEVAKAGMKAFYLQRTGMPIEEQYAGVYARPAAHPDNEVMVHPSAASKKRPAGTVISSPYGWYDAGDFNKYIVNSGFTIGMMLDAYAQAPEYFNAMELNIPESQNLTADFLDEIMYNLKWMITMQDPADGGVYHKLTNPSFEAFIMPVEAKKPRYVVQKGTCATLDFAATLAQSARIFMDMPDYADWTPKAIAAAEKAYDWAKKNPNVMYEQDKINEKFEPKISTGTYGDGSALDEFFWAATELYLTTGKKAYLADAKKYAPKDFILPVWGDLSALGTFEWINAENTEMTELLKPGLLAYADAQLAQTATSSFHAPFGNVPTDFHWASIPEGCAGMGVCLMYAYKLTGEEKYLKGALQNVDYMLGRNATGYCFVTGFGSKPVMHPHQRISSCDGIEDPLPGFISGGPNPGKQDLATVQAEYPSDYPDECYLDNQNSYASNEIAINWNAYLVALAGWVDAAMSK